jgi:hypothetical protein
MKTPPAMRPIPSAIWVLVADAPELTTIHPRRNKECDFDDLQRWTT